MASLEEFEGKNVDKAVEAACKTLNISKEKLIYRVVSHGSTGIFGLVGAKKAKINVTLPELAPKEVEESENKEQEVRPQDDEIPEATVSRVDEDAAIFKNGDLGNPVEIGRTALRRIIDAITLDAKISVEENAGRILYRVEGGNVALLIGKRGQTLEAIQYLVEKIVNKQNIKRVRIQIDVEKYLEKRRTKLQALALRMAEKTKKTGKPSTIGQMNAYDRRIVHLVLKEDKMVRTQSIGDGFLRKLVIFSKSSSHRRKRG